MDFRSIPEREILEGVYIIRGAALSKKSKEFEQHILSNKKIVTFYNDVLLHSSRMEFFDCDTNASPFCGKNGLPDRCFITTELDGRILPRDYPITIPVMETIIGDGLGRGLPIGVALYGNDKRKREILGLGRVLDGRYGKVVDFIGTKYEGEIRIYDNFDLRFNTPCSYNIRN